VIVEAISMSALAVYANIIADATAHGTGRDVCEPLTARAPALAGRPACPMTQEAEPQRKRAIVAAVQLPSVSDLEFDASLAELRQLAKTLGSRLSTASRRSAPASTRRPYFGEGKREELRALQDTADVILVDHEISPSQAHNLEKEIGREVMDRTMVILEIFRRHARSRAARARSRSRGSATWGRACAKRRSSPVRRAGSAAAPGGRGAGEAHGELDRRKIRDRIAELQQELDAIDLERRTQRTRRQARHGLARVALVGYTNAGKSTLMRALTGSEALVADKLFATLDTTGARAAPRTRFHACSSATRSASSRNLPHGLVASFKSTLDEALEASLLAHVVDASDPGYERQLAVTEEVPRRESARRGCRALLVFNKIDRAGDEIVQREREAALRAEHPGSIVMSARREADVAKLHDADRRVLPTRPRRGRAVPPLVRAKHARRGPSRPARCSRSAPTAKARCFASAASAKR
jgi:GTP-binding protein HflX